MIDARLGISVCTFALGALGAGTQARAQKPPPTGPVPMCFAIVPAPANVAPFTLMKLDRCTGATWVLSRTAIPDPSGKPSTAGVWRWTPVE